MTKVLVHLFLAHDNPVSYEVDYDINDEDEDDEDISLGRNKRL